MRPPLHHHRPRGHARTKFKFTNNTPRAQFLAFFLHLHVQFRTVSHRLSMVCFMRIEKQESSERKRGNV